MESPILFQYQKLKFIIYLERVSNLALILLYQIALQVSNVRTHYNDEDIYQYEDINYNNILSDHVMVSGVYNNKNIAKGSQF